LEKAQILGRPTGVGVNLGNVKGVCVSGVFLHFERKTVCNYMLMFKSLLLLNANTKRKDPCDTDPI